MKVVSYVAFTTETICRKVNKMFQALWIFPNHTSNQRCYLQPLVFAILSLEQVIMAHVAYVHQSNELVHLLFKILINSCRIYLFL